MSFIEVRHFKLIKAIAETGNVTKAAQRLFLTQPALSHQLGDLEGKFEIQLFHRTKKKMILTQAGKVFLKGAEKVLSEIRQTERHINKIVHGDSGVLQIGTTCVLSYKWLPEIMRQFQEIYPKVEIELKTSLDVFEDLKNDSLDLVISAMDDEYPGFTSESLFEDEILVTMFSGDLLSSKAFLTAEDFKGQTLISYQDPIKGDLYNDYLVPACIEPAKLIRAQQPEAAIELIKSGFGISLFPRWAIRSYLESGSLCGRSLDRQGLSLVWKAIRLEGRKVSVYQKEFVRLIAESTIV